VQSNGMMIYSAAMSDVESSLFGQEEQSGRAETYGRHSTSIVPSHVLRQLIRARREVLATEKNSRSYIVALNPHLSGNCRLIPHSHCERLRSRHSGVAAVISGDEKDSGR
jgi:hypothetical protein